MTNKENNQPVHNESVVQGIASEFGEKDISGENSLHTCPNGCTICSLCKVGATGELEDNLIYKKYTNERLDNQMHLNNIKLIDIYSRTIEQFRIINSLYPNKYNKDITIKSSLNLLGENFVSKDLQIIHQYSLLYILLSLIFLIYLFVLLCVYLYFL